MIEPFTELTEAEAGIISGKHHVIAVEGVNLVKYECPSIDYRLVRVEAID